MCKSVICNFLETTMLFIIICISYTMYEYAMGHWIFSKKALDQQQKLSGPAAQESLDQHQQKSPWIA